MHLEPGQLEAMVAEAIDDSSYIICHGTLPYGNHPDARPAICRDFADCYSTWRPRVIARLFGFVEVEPPGPPAPDTTGS